MKRFIALVITISAIVPISTSQASPIGVGTRCTTLGNKLNLGATNFVCVKSGHSLVWSKATISKKSTTPSPSPLKTPSLTSNDVFVNATFDNLLENRKSLPFTAWKKTSDLIGKSTSKLGKLDLNTGPNTKPWFNDLPKVLSLVSRAFPNEQEAKDILVIRYNYKDLDWATNLLKSKISSQFYDQLNDNEGGRLLSSNCDLSGTCRGSKEQTTPDGLAILLIGVPNSKNEDVIRYSSGQLEAHEYFHSLQRVPFIGKNLQNANYPPRWFVEGSAEWIQNGSVNFDKFSKYQDFIGNDCDSYTTCARLSEKIVSDYLSKSNQGNGMTNFDQQYAYSLGSKVCELLVSIAGPESLIKIWEEESKGIGWDAAFLKVYGSDWNQVYPVLAKVVNLNIQDGI